jgi:hypothetical protein
MKGERIIRSRRPFHANSDKTRQHSILPALILFWGLRLLLGG